MNLIAWIIVGSALGWLITFIVRDRSLKGLIINVLIGIAGALATAYLLTPFFYPNTYNLGNFSLPGLLFALGGAASLLAIAHIVQRKSTMNDVDIQAKWTQVRSKIHVRWNKLTEEDVEHINGNHVRFIKVIRERYGCDDEKAEDDLQSYLRAVVDK